MWLLTRHPVSGAGYQPEGVVSDPGPVTELLQVGAQCCDARLIAPDPAHHLGWRILGDTTEGAIIVAAAKAGVDPNVAMAVAKSEGFKSFSGDNGTFSRFLWVYSHWCR